MAAIVDDFAAREIVCVNFAEEILFVDLILMFFEKDFLRI